MPFENSVMNAGAGAAAAGGGMVDEQAKALMVRRERHGLNLIEYTVYEAPPDTTLLTGEHVLALVQSEADGERIVRAIRAAEGDKGPVGFWREEFEYVRRDRDDTIQRHLDAEERVKQGHLRENRLRDGLQDVLDGAFRVDQDEPQTVRCKLCNCGLLGGSSDEIVHHPSCPIPTIRGLLSS